MITDKFLFGYNRDSKFLFAQQKGNALSQVHLYLYIRFAAVKNQPYKSATQEMLNSKIKAWAKINSTFL